MRIAPCLYHRHEMHASPQVRISGRRGGSRSEETKKKRKPTWVVLRDLTKKQSKETKIQTLIVFVINTFPFPRIPTAHIVFGSDQVNVILDRNMNAVRERERVRGRPNSPNSLSNSQLHRGFVRGETSRTVRESPTLKPSQTLPNLRRSWGIHLCTALNVSLPRPSLIQQPRRFRFRK